MNFNETIDAQFSQGYVRTQQAFWRKTNLGVTTRLTRADVLNDVNNVATPDQILYFYCHAIAYGLNQPGGLDASSLVLTNKPITLKDFRLEAPTEIPLSGKPLGETFLDLRQEFVARLHNPPGLLYALHCDADTMIDPPSAGALVA
ncbi:hypothetical protein AWB69_07352 [Caballeronia udeis]|uniref:Uncharacterized protein n=1 Tax=Caballeronia udeis TaxID=1232866 RepID=A0A158J8A3_9BURK|nr:hypothetical protein [Caballeronia udeis]SAL65097.1 hypothetical protein AWB69_07352 [Caballeronia udeis]